jgi:hypothetical protein
VAVRKVDRVLLSQAVLVLVLVASIVIQDRVDGAAQLAMLVLGGAACIGLVVTLALRRTSPFPSQNARRGATASYNPTQPPPAPATPLAPSPAARRRRNRKR